MRPVFSALGAAPPISVPACHKVSMVATGDFRLLPSGIFRQVNAGISSMPGGSYTITATTMVDTVIHTAIIPPTGVVNSLIITDVQDLGRDPTCKGPPTKILPITIPGGSAPSSSSRGVMIVGVAVALAVAGAGGYYLWRRKRR